MPLELTLTDSQLSQVANYLMGRMAGDPPLDPAFVDRVGSPPSLTEARQLRARVAELERCVTVLEERVNNLVASL